MSEQPTTSGQTPKSEGFPGFVALTRLTASATRLLDGVRTLLRDFVELARTEIIYSAKALGTGIVLSLLAVGLGLLTAIFLMVALAYGLVALGLPAWAAFLVVAGVLLLAIGALAFVAGRKFKAVTLPNRTLAMLDEIGKPANEPGTDSSR
ncbi:MAG: phage holin family protein [Actinomycetales bacterium]|nr:phage holin family protein [Actinomycetales bacterium]